MLINYWCNRNNMTNASKNYMVNEKQINKWIGYFNKIQYDIDMIYNNHRFKVANKLIKDINVDDHIKKILKIGKGKISICGGAIISILSATTPLDYDVFFHGGNVDEAQEILNKCLNYLKSIAPEIVYTRNKYLVEAKSYSFKIQFLKRVYATKEQVLLGFDLAASRIGYNLIDGIYATIDGGLAFAMSAYPFDIKKYSKASINRIDKYCSCKDFGLMIYNLNLDILSLTNKDTYDLINNDDEDKILSIKKYTTNNNYYINESVSIFSDYETEGEIINNILDDRELSFSSSNLEDVIDLTDEFIEETIRNNAFDLKQFDKMTKIEIKRYLGCNYPKFATFYFVEEDYEMSKSLWMEKISQYIKIAKQKVYDMKNDEIYLQGWKYLNPGSNNFGQNHPANYKLGNDVKSTQIGLKMDRFQALMDCRKNIDYINDIPNEVFKLICECWLKFEVDEAKIRLFGLSKFNTLNIKSFLNNDTTMIFS